MKTGYSAIDRLPQEHLDKIDAISDERSTGEGFWVYLKTPFCNREMEPWGGLHIIHESSPSKCLSQIRKANKCNCDDCRKELSK